MVALLRQGGIIDALDFFIAEPAISPVISILASTPTEASDPYNDVPTRLLPTHPLQHDPLPRKDRIASPTTLNGRSDAR